MDPIYKEPVGDQVHKQVPVLPYLTKSLLEPPEPDPDGVHSQTFVLFQPARRLGDVAEDRDRKHHPPHRNRQKRDPRSGPGVREPEELGTHDHRRMNHQQESTPQVTQRIARRRNPVHLVLVGDMGQQRVGERQRGRNPDRTGDETGSPQAPSPPPPRSTSPPSPETPKPIEEPQETLLRPHEVRDSAQHRRGDGDEQQGQAVDVAPVNERSALGKIRTRHLLKVQRQDHHPNRGNKERGVRPVIERPTPEFFALQS